MSLRRKKKLFINYFGKLYYIMTPIQVGTTYILQSEDNFSVCNLQLSPTYMECIIEEKMEIVQEMVDQGAQTDSLRTS